MMINQTVLVGRIANELKIEELESGRKYCYLTLAVPRSFKNENGEYETDFISCVLHHCVAENTVEYCKKGDLVGIRGRLQMRKVEQENEIAKNYLEVVAEKLTFLSRKEESEEK